MSPEVIDASKYDKSEIRDVLLQLRPLHTIGDL